MPSNRAPRARFGKGVFVWVKGQGCRVYLDRKSRQNVSPKLLQTAQKDIILHTFGAGSSPDRPEALNRKPMGVGVRV